MMVRTAAGIQMVEMKVSDEKAYELFSEATKSSDVQSAEAAKEFWNAVRANQ